MTIQSEVWNVEKMTNDLVTVQKIAQELKMNTETVRLTLIKDLDMKEVHAKMILQNLKSEKNQVKGLRKNFSAALPTGLKLTDI